MSVSGDEFRSNYRRRVLSPFLGEHRAELEGLGGDSLGIGGGLDLVVLYDLTESMPRQERDRRVGEVHDIWAKLPGEYQGIVDSLQQIQKFVEREAGRVGSEGFWAQCFDEHRHRVRVLLDELGEVAGHEYGVYGVVTLGLLREVASQLGVRSQDVTDQHLCKLARGAGLTVTTPVGVREVDLAPGLDDVLRSGHRTLVHAIFGEAELARFTIVDGFAAPSGLRLTRGVVRARRDALNKKPQHDSTMYTDRALAAIENMGPTSDKELHAIVLSHLLRQIRRQPPRPAALRVRYGRELGLCDIDAGRIALHLADLPVSQPPAPAPAPAAPATPAAPQTAGRPPASTSTAPLASAGSAHGGAAAPRPYRDGKASAALTAERTALVALYHATGGPKWKTSTHWASNTPVDRWYGITTDRNGYIAHIDLPNNQLSGSVPPAFCRLASLQHLDLSGNGLISLPPAFDQLRNLQHLDLSRNSLGGIRLKLQLNKLRSLQHLDLSHNVLGFEHKLGDLGRLGRLASLQHLDLSENRLEGSIPREFGKLVHLQHLDLSENRLEGSIPREFGKLVHLQHLDLSENRLEGSIPREFGKLVHLQHLDLSENRLEGSIPPQLYRLGLAHLRI